MKQFSAGCMIVLLSLMVVTSSAHTQPNPKQPANPVIAIVTTPLIDCLQLYPLPPELPHAQHCVESFFVRWLQASGVRVVPLRWDATVDERISILEKVNGVLLQGGSLYQLSNPAGGPLWHDYVNNQSLVFKYAMERNKMGDPFFLWGTCQGFQTLTVIASQNFDVLKCNDVGTDPSMLPLDFTDAQPQSRIFGSFARESGLNIIEDAKNNNVTLNYHSCGIEPSAALSQPSFSENFNIISTNTDLNGRPFISTIEAKAANIHAVQFHPERPPYEFDNNVINHDMNTIEMSLYLSTFVAKHLRMNNHSYPSASMAEASTIENYPLSNSGWGASAYWLP